ncbi:MAG: Uma2 family endonuclease [bacterium]
MLMATHAKRWTLAELHRLPDDGNKYELVRGELFVTPAPTLDHETILARLTRILDPFVAANNLGLVYHPRAIMRFEGSEVEPDLMVRRQPSARDVEWNNAPTPILLVEVLSDSTRRRDLVSKRQLYLDAGVAEYWIVDPDANSVRVVRNGESDQLAIEQLTWTPAGATRSLVIELRAIFG